MPCRSATSSATECGTTSPPRSCSPTPASRPARSAHGRRTIQTWRRLHVTFPASITTHSAEQVFYFGADGLLRRLDYTTEVNARDPVAHYTEGYKTFDGLAFPTRRRVYRRNPDSTPDRSLTAITLDIHDITAA
jgi:hypothetical protein